MPPEQQSHHDEEAYETSWVLNLPRLKWFRPVARTGRAGPCVLKLVDRHGFAPCSPACGAGDLLNDRAAQKKTGSGGRNRTGALAAYEAAALPLGDPAIEKWHGVSVLPRARGVLEALLRKLAPAAHVVWFENWCGQPDLHRHPLIGTQASCSWTMTANERRRL